MTSPSELFGALAVVGCTAWIVLGWVSVVWAARRGHRAARWGPEEPLAPVTVLKPLCGADPSLEANLESFFVQDHPCYELLFGVEDPEDPAVAVVLRLARRHPVVRWRLVTQAAARGINPKVRNLRGMLPHARHDLVLISDSNIRVPPHYAREMVRTMTATPRIGLVTSLFAGVEERTLGAALDSVQLNGFVAAGATLPTALGDAAVVGKSVLLSRARFERVGGFERLADVLAEDYVMGKMVQHAGFSVRIAPTVLANVTGNVSVGAFFRRHQRWSMLRFRLRPWAFVLEPLASPLALAPLAVGWLGALGFGWVAAMLMIRDVGGWLALRGPRRLWVPLGLSLVREVFALAIWLGTPFKRDVSWRGHRVRVGAGTLVFERPSSR